jgi:acyl-CoA synthetase (AMP-forming)/AMP-acid ligase II
MHVAAQLARLALARGDHPAIVDESGSWTFRTICGRMARLGNALHGLGLQPGDRVALLIPDCREYLEADYGTMAAGLVRVPMDPRLTRRELVALLQHAGARALIAHASFAETVTGLTDEVESLEWLIGIGEGVGLDYETLLERASDQLPPARNGDELATLNFSGGTTGSPKAIMLRHRNLMTVTQETIRGFDIRPDAVFLNVRPLWPIAQVIAMSYWFAGATVVLGGRGDPDQLAAKLDRSGATRSSLVPTQLVRWINHLNGGNALPRLQTVHVGGSRIPLVAFERAHELLGPRVSVLYGMTEAPVTCYLPPQRLATADADDRRRLMESVGRGLAGYEVRVAETDGELLVRGGNVMAGYWRNEAATQKSLHDGWLHTGDIARRDADGTISIVGRLNDVIRSGASSVMPKEVEDVLASHPAVDDVAVLGLPDPEWGEAVTAFVVLRAGMTASEHDLVEHCRQHLAGYKKPRSVRFVASLPRSHYGKVIKAQLLAQG